MHDDMSTKARLLQSRTIFFDPSTTTMNYDYNTVEGRVAFLREKARDNPAQEDNIKAIINYYQQGGRFPNPGREIVFAFDGEAKLGTLDQMIDGLEDRNTVPWYNVCRPTALFLQNPNLICMPTSSPQYRWELACRKTRPTGMQR